MEHSPEIKARQNLQDRLLNSVKQVQMYFGARQEIATESDARVSALCVEWETVLTHGAKKPKPKNSLRLTGRTEGVSLWPLAKLCVSAEDLQRFFRLNHVKSELGRGRAWLRAAINERTLENYMHSVLAQDEELRKLYEVDAFLLDQERSSMLPIMAAGLSSIIFSMSTDASYLNTPSRSVEVPVSSPSLPPPLPTVEVPPTQEQRFPPHQDSYFANNSQPTQPSFTNRHVYEADDDMIAVPLSTKKKRPRKPKSKSSHTVDERLDPNHERMSLQVDKPKESISSSSSRHSLDSVSDDGQSPLYVALTIPSDLVSGEARAAADATAMVLSASSPPPSHEQRSPSPLAASLSHEVGDGQQAKGDDSDMRAAMLSLSKMKDDLEFQNRELKKHASDLQEKVFLLEQELERHVQELCEERDAHASQKMALERENDLLRDQLKKHLSMLQTKHSSTSSISSDGVKNITEPSLETEPVTDASSDKKLQEMAEMYADLMELNDRLHRNLADKDGTICQLVHQLRDASIEVPVAPHQLPAAAMETKLRLVEVWIPSVIKKGSGFHVYQVFLSVKGVEWNVYRRYTEFRDFHRQLQKHLPQVSTFNFPPKKAIGNKSTQVVEERRQRLQEYLRFVIKTCSGSNPHRSKPIINRSITKEMLVTLFPFFKEDFNQETPAPQTPLYSGL